MTTASGFDHLVTSTSEEDAVDETVVLDERDLPSAPDVTNIFLGGILLISSLAACYLAATIILPIILAFVLMLVLQAPMRWLRRLRVPRGIAAALIIVLLFGLFIGLGMVLAAPAASWVQKLPSALPRIQERLSFVKRAHRGVPEPAWSTG
jgi:predicted PurR-regulated permease PerM